MTSKEELERYKEDLEHELERTATDDHETRGRIYIALNNCHEQLKE